MITGFAQRKVIDVSNIRYFSNFVLRKMFYVNNRLVSSESISLYNDRAIEKAKFIFAVITISITEFSLTKDSTSFLFSFNHHLNLL